MRLNLYCQNGHHYAVETTGETPVHCPECGLAANPATVSALIQTLELAAQQYLSGKIPAADQQD